MFPCNECEFSATTASYLHHHKKRKHIGVKYPCTECDYMANEPGDLRKHNDSKHGGPKRYFCSLCDDYEAYQSHILRQCMTELHILLISVDMSQRRKAIY